MARMNQKQYESGDIQLQYYEIENNLHPLVLLHAQGVDGKSFERAAQKLSKKYHIYSIDCYGHGGSLHDPQKYNIAAIGEAVIRFIQDRIGRKIYLLGHSSGGLIAAYIAARTDLCEQLILEDPPFFSCQGERRKATFNYADLSTLCHRYLAQSEPGDFVLYYFEHQYAWNFFPEKSRERVREKLTTAAAHYRRKHPDKDLKVPFWPKAALAGFQGMNLYDPRFGEAFYNDSFHSGILHEELLKKIQCPTLFLKAKTNFGEDGCLMAALSEDDVKKVEACIENCTVLRFDCGHGIHIEKEKQFVNCLLDLV